MRDKLAAHSFNASKIRVPSGQSIQHFSSTSFLQKSGHHLVSAFQHNQAGLLPLSPERLLFFHHRSQPDRSEWKRVLTKRVLVRLIFTTTCLTPTYQISSEAYSGFAFCMGIFLFSLYRAHAFENIPPRLDFAFGVCHYFCFLLI